METIAALCVMGVIGFIVMLFLYNKPTLLIYLQLCICLSMEFFISYFHITTSIHYVTDLINFLLILCVTIEVRNKRYSRLLIPVLLSIFLYFICTVFSYIVNQHSFVLYLWGIRNIFRYYFFFLSCVVFLRREDIDRIMNLMVVFLGVNVCVCTYQYFVQGYRMDFNGGLFGTIVGCNANMNVFITQLTIVAVIARLYKARGALFSGFIILSSLYIAALSELKVFFFELVLIFVLAILYSTINLRSVCYLLVCVVAVICMVKFFLYLYPSWNGFFNVDNLIQYNMNVSYGSSEGALNRFVGVPYVYKNLLNNYLGKIFGIGLGAADYISPFYLVYRYLHYEWFSSSWTILENGVVGSIAYLLVYVTILIQAISLRKKEHDRREYYVISIITVFLCFIYFMYNASLRVEIAYVLQVFLASALICGKEKYLTSTHCCFRRVE